ncbi:MAG: type IV pilin protein [Gammaproteobacteria bacterium]
MKRNSRRIIKGFKGFTLIELLIAVAIVAILAAIAYPTYSDAVRKARRADAKSLLLEIAARQEQSFSSRAPNTYAQNLTQLGYANPQPTEGGWYTVSVTAATNTAGAACAGTTADPCTAFTLTAAPQNDQAKDKCKGFTLDHFGVKGLDPDIATLVAECW